MVGMNRYGRMALERMREFQPEVLAGIEDPDSYFSNLGEDLAQRIEELAERIAGPARPGESYLDRLGRLREARISAASDIMAQVGVPEQENDQAPAWPAAVTGWMPVVGPPDPDDLSYRQEQELRGR
jgi:hypothetical protein